MRFSIRAIKYASIGFLLTFLLCTTSHREYDSAAKDIVVTDGSGVVMRIDSVQGIISGNHLDCNDTNWNHDLELRWKPNPADSQQMHLLFYFNDFPAVGDSLVVVNKSPAGTACKTNFFTLVDSLGNSIDPDSFSVKLMGVPFDTSIHVNDVTTNAPVNSSEISDTYGFTFDFQWKNYHATGKVSYVILSKETSFSCFLVEPYQAPNMM
jgi:hypothetical protein